MDKLTALGEVLCAAMHLKDSHPITSMKLQELVLSTLNEKQWGTFRDTIKELPILVKDTEKEPGDYRNPLQETEWENLCRLLRAYSLLFVEISYERLNMTWATGEIFTAAMKEFQQTNNRNAYMQLREVWKKIQSMDQSRDVYEDARAALQREIVDRYVRLEGGSGAAPENR